MGKSIFSNNTPSTEKKQEKEKKKSENKNLLKTDQTCPTLISTKTLVNVTTAPLQGQRCKSVTAQAPACLLSTLTINCSSSHGNSSTISHVLCSTTVDCVSFLPDIMKIAPKDEEERDLIVEMDDRCGSYDDVMLAFDEAEMEADRVSAVDVGYISDFDSRCSEWGGTDHSFSPEGPLSMQHKTTHSLKMQNDTRDSSGMCKSVNVLKSNNKVFNATNEVLQSSTTKDSDKCFALPKVVDWSKLNQCRTRYLKLDRSKKNGISPIRPQPFLPEKTSTPNPSTVRPKTKDTKPKEPLKSSFTIYTDPEYQAAESPHPSTSGSLHPPRNILFSLQRNTLSSRAKLVSGDLAGKVQKITSPLCACGRRARQQVVSNGGPNHGRGFYCCPVRRSGGGGSLERGCGFFKWESALLKSSVVAPPAVGSSVSLCQVNSRLPYRLPQRKSY